MQCVSCYISLIHTCKSISNKLISQDTKVFEEFLERVVLGVKTQLSLLIQSLPFKGPVFLKRSLISVLCARCHPPTCHFKSWLTNQYWTGH